MSMQALRDTNRTVEAERLIGLARALLDRAEEEIVVNYLDHAVEALQIVHEDASTPATVDPFS